MLKAERVKIGMWSAGSDFTRKRRAAGFTLIELIIVLVIGAAVVAVAPPLIAKALPGVELRAAAREVASSLRYARNRAVSQRTETTLSLDVEEKIYRLSGSPKIYRLPKRVEFSLTTAQAAGESDDVGSIRFFPGGGSTGGRIVMGIESRRYSIDVDWLTGRIRVLE